MVFDTFNAIILFQDHSVSSFHDSLHFMFNSMHGRRHDRAVGQLAPTETRLWGQNCVIAPTEIRRARSERYK